MVQDFYERLDKAAEDEIHELTTGKFFPNRGEVEKWRGSIGSGSEHTMHTGDESHHRKKIKVSKKEN